MTREDLIEWVKTQLGYPVVDLEIPDVTISSCIDNALDEVTPWLPLEHIITVPVTGTCIDLTEYRVGTIVSIHKAPTDELNTGTIDPFTYQHHDLTDMSIITNMLETQRIGYYKDNISYQLIGSQLYIDPGIPIPSTITIEYYLDDNSVDVEDYTDRRYLKFLKDFTLAFVRGVLSDIRGKYTPSNSPVMLDSDTQLDRSNSELHRLRQALEDASNASVFITD